jgi:hypothetical protein
MQEVIVYRNPAEAAFWHSMANGGFMTFVLFGVVMLISFIIFFYTLEKIRNGKGDWNVGISLFISFATALLVVWKFG